MALSIEQIPRWASTALAAGIGAAAFFVPATPAKGGPEEFAGTVPAKTAEPFPVFPIQLADPEAAKLQRKVRHGQPVPYDASVGVEWQDTLADGTVIDEETIAPLELNNNGQEAWFKLIGHALKKVRVVRITDPTAVEPAKWVLQHPAVTVTSRGGIINTNNVDGTPVGPIQLSDGRREYVPIGQTDALLDRPGSH